MPILKKQFLMLSISVLIAAALFFIIFIFEFKNNTDAPGARPELIDYELVTPKIPATQNLVFNLNAKTINLKNNERVVSWKDSGPGKFEMVQISAASAPVFLAGNNNKFPTVLFDGQSYLESLEVKGTAIVDENMILISILKQNSHNGHSDIMEAFAWGDCESNRFFTHYSNFGMNFHYGPPENRIDVQFANLPELFKAVVIKKRGPMVSVQINNQLLATVDNHKSELNLASERELFVGSSSCGHNFHGEIAEIAIYKNLTDAEKDQAVKYYLEKYNIIY